MKFIRHTFLGRPRGVRHAFFEWERLFSYATLECRQLEGLGCLQSSVKFGRFSAKLSDFTLDLTENHRLDQSAQNIFGIRAFFCVEWRYSARRAQMASKNFRQNLGIKFFVYANFGIKFWAQVARNERTLCAELAQNRTTSTHKEIPRQRLSYNPYCVEFLLLCTIYKI